MTCFFWTRTSLIHKNYKFILTFNDFSDPATIGLFHKGSIAEVGYSHPVNWCDSVHICTGDLTGKFFKMEYLDVIVKTAYTYQTYYMAQTLSIQFWRSQTHLQICEHFIDYINSFLHKNDFCVENWMNRVKLRNMFQVQKSGKADSYLLP